MQNYGAFNFYVVYFVTATSITIFILLLEMDYHVTNPEFNSSLQFTQPFISFRIDKMITKFTRKLSTEGPTLH